MNTAKARCVTQCPPLPLPPQDSDDASSSLTGGEQCYEEELSPLKEDKPPTLSDLGNPSASPRADKLQLRHTPDSGIAMGSGYPSSISSNESPPPINKLDPRFNEGQIVATLNPSIQAARKRSRSLPELSSNVVSLSFVPNQTSMTPPPLLRTIKVPTATSQHNPLTATYGVQRPRLFSAPQKGTIPLSHSPAVVTRPVMTTQFGKHDHALFSPMVGRSYGQASQLGPKMGMTSQGPTYQSSNFATYSPYANSSLQPPSTYPPSYSYSTGVPPPPFMAHPNPQTSPLYPHSVPKAATSIPTPYNQLQSASMVPPASSAGVGFQTYSGTHPSTSILLNTPYAGYSPSPSTSISYDSYSQVGLKPPALPVSSLPAVTTTFGGPQVVPSDDGLQSPILMTPNSLSSSGSSEINANSGTVDVMARRQPYSCEDGGHSSAGEGEESDDNAMGELRLQRRDSCCSDSTGSTSSEQHLFSRT